MINTINTTFKNALVHLTDYYAINQISKISDESPFAEEVLTSGFTSSIYLFSTLVIEFIRSGKIAAIGKEGQAMRTSLVVCNLYPEFLTSDVEYRITRQ